jgi:biopolymer transport protein ExbB/TolQ
VDEQTQVKAFLESGVGGGIAWVVSTIVAALSAALAGLARRTWSQHEARLGALEELCMIQHKEARHGLNQHAVADAATHDAIRKELATELRAVYAKIDSTNEAGEHRAEALSEQMTLQHGQITARVDKILELMVGGR